MVSVALADWGRYEVVRRDEISLKVRDKKIPELDIINQMGREETAKLLGADALVIGSVDAYESAFILMIQSAKVIFTARCLDAATGQEMWKIQVNWKDYYTTEERLVTQAMRTAVEQLRVQIEKGANAKPEK